METVAIVLRRSRKKMIDVNRRVEIRNLRERISLKVLIGGEGLSSNGSKTHRVEFLQSMILTMEIGWKGS